LLDNFDTWVVTFAEAERAPAGIDATTTLLTYMFRVIDPVHHDQLRAKIRKLGPHAEDVAMTIAEQWLEEGRKQGLAKGREEGRIAALRSLLSSKFGAQMLEATYEARLQAATPAVVDHYLRRVLVADSLAAVFED
jgi:flagellar biosynthesis/type III secretory pathway protein FliH